MHSASAPRFSAWILVWALAVAAIASSCASEEPHPLEEVQGLSELYDHMGRKRVVRVFGTETTGKGVVLGDGSWILTGEHLVGSDPSVRVQNVEGIEHEARIVASDPTRGLALLRLDEQRFDPARLELDKIPETGDDIYVMTEDAFVGLAPASGQIAGRREVKAGYLLRLSGFVSPEELGGPLFDSDGRIVGIVIPDELVDREVRASYAQPVPALLAFLDAAGGPRR